ncbi:unnamed protein product [Arabidopsis thaliana]|uniref:Replication protein A 70 kDa DNA-binding subunit B/D first OB fold domain-containing protein n=1 Tax=Arabidopsis thaliana TaxID=3702 RepID=A0A654FN98_ARATH|nr:unnamed protein product [Arabidopsis thaliana]
MPPNTLKTNENPLSYSTLDALDGKIDSPTIVVRLIQSWEVRDFKRNNLLLSVDCLLIDEKANAIQGSIHPRRLHKFKPKLIEGNIFSIHDFDVKKQQNSYRLTNHDYKIFFNDHTSMNVVDNIHNDIPHEYFRIQTFKDIEMIVDKGENLPDIVGQVSRIRNSDKLDETTIPPKTTNNVILTGETAYISIWDKLACKVRNDLDQLQGEPLIVIVTGVNPKTVRGELYLNTTASTRFYWNIENDVTKDFRKSTNFQKLLVPSCEEQTTELVPTNIESITQILAYVNDQSGKAGQAITCGNCGSVSIGRLRYRIEVIVDDGCQTSTFIIFDEAGQTLLKTTASNLASKNNVGENDPYGEIVPQEIHNIIGKDFFFYIKVASYNFTAKHQSFSVSKMVTPSPMVTKRPTETPDPSPTKSTSDTENINITNKKRRTRKNITKVVVEESDDELVRSSHSDRALDDV